MRSLNESSVIILMSCFCSFVVTTLIRFWPTFQRFVTLH